MVPVSRTIHFITFSLHVYRKVMFLPTEGKADYSFQVSRETLYKFLSNYIGTEVVSVVQLVL